MSLVQAIDKLLDFVKNHWQTPDYGDRQPQFEALDIAVYVEVRKLGLHDSDLPRKDATFPPDEEVIYFGRTNVPGAWDKSPDRAATLTLMATSGWLADMQTLRALAEADISNIQQSTRNSQSKRSMGSLSPPSPTGKMTLDEQALAVFIKATQAGR